MGIKVKYDPVGSSAMAAYATGVGQAQERNKKQAVGILLEQDRLNRMQKERALDRNADAERQNENLTFRAWENLQQDLSRQDEADLEFRRRGLMAPSPMPEGVKADPIASKGWSEADKGIRDISGGRTFDPTLPDTQIGLGRLEELKRGIEEKYKTPTPAEQAMKNSYLGDEKGNPLPPLPEGAPVPPGAMRWSPDPRGGRPAPWEYPKDPATVKAEQDQKAEKDKQRAESAARLARDEAAILKNDVDYADVAAKKVAIDDRRAAHDAIWGPKSSPVAAPPPTGAPAPVAAPPAFGSGAPTPNPASTAPVAPPIAAVGVPTMPTNPPVINNAEEYARIPSGTIFVDRDGQTRRKR
jgi:hypothetical protein